MTRPELDAALDILDDTAERTRARWPQEWARIVARREMAAKEEAEHSDEVGE